MSSPFSKYSSSKIFKDINCPFFSKNLIILLTSKKCKIALWILILTLLLLSNRPLFIKVRNVCTPDKHNPIEQLSLTTGLLSFINPSKKISSPFGPNSNKQSIAYFWILNSLSFNFS